MFAVVQLYSEDMKHALYAMHAACLTHEALLVYAYMVFVLFSDHLIHFVIMVLRI